MGLKHEMAWSKLQSDMYRDCPRQYYIRYYGKEEKFGDREKQLRQITTPWFLAGSVVHDQIAISLKRFLADGETPSGLADKGSAEFDRRIGYCRQLMKRVIAENAPIGKHDHVLHNEYYPYNLPQHRSVEAYREKCANALSNFEFSEHLETILRFPKAAHVPAMADDLPTFMLNGVKVYAVYDYIIKDEAQTHIIDWKLGQDNSGSIQLAVYAMYAAERFPASDIKVHLTSLRTIPPWDPQEVSETVLDAVREQVVEETALIAATSKPVTLPGYGGEPHQYFEDFAHNFPATSGDEVCMDCNYIKLCMDGKSRFTALHKPRQKQGAEPSAEEEESENVGHQYMSSTRAMKNSDDAKVEPITESNPFLEAELDAIDAEFAVEVAERANKIPFEMPSLPVVQDEADPY